MLAGSLGAGAVGTLQVGQFLFQRRLQLVELGQLLVQGFDLARQLAFLGLQAIDALVVFFLELVELLAQGIGNFFDVFFFNSHERLLTFCPKGISGVPVTCRHPPLAVKLRRSPWP
ncbi:hypothetical protein D3C77_626910 [compost metagenome]